MKYASTILICMSLFIGCTSDNQAPEVQVTFPDDGSTVSGIVTITVDASDNKEVCRVDLYVDNSLVESFTSEPYSHSWNTASLTDSSDHAIYAKAYDDADNSSTSDIVTVTVYNGGGGTGQWELVYSTDFSSNPYWITNNSSRFYYVSSDYTYYMESYQGADEYAYKSSSWNSNSIKLEFDIKISHEEWGSHVGLGLYDSDVSTDGNFLEVHFGHDSGGKEACIYYRNQSGLNYRMFYGDYQLNTWYHFVLTYVKSTNTATLNVTEKTSGNPFCTINVNGMGSFSGLTNLGFSNVGVTANNTTFKSKVDNICYYNWIE